MEIIVINGYPMSGKDEFTTYCKEILKRKTIQSYNISTVDKVKEIAKLMGWDGEKTPKARKFLSDRSYI